MDYSEWLPIYREIAEDLDISMAEDRASARKLEKKLTKKPNLKKLEKTVKEKTIVLGDAPTLQKEIKKIKHETDIKTVIAADNATKTALEHNITPDIVTTDLDGDINSILEADKKGAITIVHAHGDNQQLIEKWTPQIKNIIGSTQNQPTDKLINYGGFTDGDRAIYIAHEFGAREIHLIGFDYEKAEKNKKKKLKWAEKLINNLKTKGVKITSQK
ncbi:78-Dihydro-6-hydroxymethylpterin-pyrophosphokinase HPPK Rossmann fold enzyme [Methanonatronarchaeum thermophilum]|uniref:6-hydroxymethyl-7,8-dihydropterin pyrophosphokinase n=1 Tax=Methanonatronarchaeum thermophilum TaxID=1927129 RepID=A0A1Y3GCD6_9EURY|nr:6-hydroxymethylpterin diphosphokinase MptE-like protein [Methanonatronarchaeum thermophilum]OUJ19108.1 78-Dihydro-6-hydroxymethylpterin-pyrophosphokinase HPPK Rossmann fold enzyme [Methanonatronarchaeum thermophilum]